MNAIDIDGLLAPISDAAPCGDDLEYDAAFQAMERAAVGKPEQQIGETVVPAEDPDWRELQRLATEILGRSKDLRAAVFVTRAAARTGGWPSFCAGLDLLRRLIETYWDDLHPKLDPDDGNDPTFRMNVLESLTDRQATLVALRTAPLVESRMLGRFGLWDIDVAKGEVSLPESFEGEPPTMGRIHAAFQEADVQAIVTVADAVQTGIAAVNAIDRFLGEKLEPGSQVDLSALQACMTTAHRTLTAALAERGVGDTVPQEERLGGPTAEQAATPGGINSRDDVVRTIDLLCEFYQRTEPSSPVPLLLQRAKGLVQLDFMQILEEIAPNGVSEAVQVLKSRDERKSES